MRTNDCECFFLSLFQSGLWNQPPDTSRFESLPPSIWEDINSIAIEQGVQAIVYDGVKRLPESLQPPRDLLLSWGVTVLSIEKRYNRYLEVTSRLNRFYESNGLQVMLIKGFGISAYYPIPKHRESGDLDIWLFGEYKKGNLLMKLHGIKVLEENPKHSCFFYEGIPVENHQSFLNISQFAIDYSILEPALIKAMNDYNNDTFELPHDTKIHIPSPMFNAIFLARHMSAHFFGSIAIRNLSDWARFLYINKGKFDTATLISALKEANLYTIMRIFTDLAIEKLGMPASFSPFSEKGDQLLKEKVWKEIISPPSFNYQMKGAITIILNKWKRFYSSKWKYELVHGESFSKCIIRSIKFHILNPKTITLTK